MVGTRPSLARSNVGLAHCQVLLVPPALPRGGQGGGIKMRPAESPDVFDVDVFGIGYDLRKCPGTWGLRLHRALRQCCWLTMTAMGSRTATASSGPSYGTAGAVRHLRCQCALDPELLSWPPPVDAVTRLIQLYLLQFTEHMRSDVCWPKPAYIRGLELL